MIQRSLTWLAGGRENDAPAPGLPPDCRDDCGSAPPRLLALRDLPGQTLVAALLKMFLTLEPSAVTARTTTRAIKLTMMAYSTAVAPRSLRRPAILT